MASRDTDPPAYSDSGPAPQPPAPPGAEPPTYDDTADAGPTDQLPTSELFNFVLDDCLIYHSPQPDRPLYELSNSPTGPNTVACAVQKLIYKHDGEGGLKDRQRHLYDFRTGGSPLGGEYVMISRQASSKFAFGDVCMMPGQATGSFAGSCKAEGHFKADQGLMGKVKDQMTWRDKNGKDVAVETKLNWRKEIDGSKVVERKPTLEVKKVMDTKSLDLLVTMWVSRVWKEAQKDQAEPFSWGKLKRATGNKTSGGGMAKAGGFL